MPNIDQARPIYERLGNLILKEGEGRNDDDRVNSSGAAGVSRAKEDGEVVKPRRFPEEEEEDLLRESNDRFVLFPIKYREVSFAVYDCRIRG